MKISDYIDEAKQAIGIPSDMKFGKHLGLSMSIMSAYRTGRAFPSDEIMADIAKYAGVPIEQALMDLNIARTAKNPAVQSVYENMAKLLKRVAAAIMLSLLFLYSAAPAEAAQLVATGARGLTFHMPNLYIITLSLAYMRGRFMRHFIPLFTRAALPACRCHRRLPRKDVRLSLTLLPL